MDYDPKNYVKRRVYGQCFLASLGFAFWAYQYSVFNSLQLYLEEFVFPGASTSTMSWIASSLDAGAIAGSVIGGILTNKLGRRQAMLWSDVLGVIGVTLTLIASLPTMIIGRAVCGIVGGINTVAVALYLVEMSPIAMAGVTGSMAIIILEVMAFISLVSGYAVPKTQKGGINDEIWRILLAIPALLNIARSLS